MLRLWSLSQSNQSFSQLLWLNILDKIRMMKNIFLKKSINNLPSWLLKNKLSIFKKRIWKSFVRKRMLNKPKNKLKLRNTCMKSKSSKIKNLKNTVLGSNPKIKMTS